MPVEVTYSDTEEREGGRQERIGVEELDPGVGAGVPEVKQRVDCIRKILKCQFTQFNRLCSATKIGLILSVNIVSYNKK
jgi:hypothetical protein